MRSSSCQLLANRFFSLPSRLDGCGACRTVAVTLVFFSSSDPSRSNRLSTPDAGALVISNDWCTLISPGRVTMAGPGVVLRTALAVAATRLRLPLSVVEPLVGFLLPDRFA